MTTDAALWTVMPSHDPHAVGLYDGVDDLVATLIEYLAPAMEHETVVAVPRREHVGPLEAGLTAAGWDLDAARRSGRFVLLDAEDLLTTFMVDHMPDRGRFLDSVGGVIAAAARNGRAIRAFGEMVGVLWERGNVPAALVLEDLWNEAALGHPLTLLCAYPASAMTQDQTDALADVCLKHTVVVPHERLGGVHPGAPVEPDPSASRRLAAFSMRPSQVRHAAWVASTALELLDDNLPRLSEHEARELIRSARAASADLESFAAGIDPESP